MANPRPLRWSQRLQGRELEVSPWASPPRHTPLQQFRPVSFTLSREARELKRTLKRHQLDLLSIEKESDSPRDNQIDYLPFDFPFAIYQPPSPPFPKRLRVSTPPFLYFDWNSPTFRIAAPPLLMDKPTSSTATSMVSFTAESLSPDMTKIRCGNTTTTN